MNPKILALVAALCLVCPTWAADASAQRSASSSLLLNSAQQELTRAMRSLAKSDPAPYFISYSITDRRAYVIVGANGALMTSMPRHTRMADVSVRVASPELDNTHGRHRSAGINSALVPLDEDPAAIARVLWQTTDAQYKRASSSYLQVKTENQVQAEEDDTSADFSKEDPQTYSEAAIPANFEPKKWEEKVRRYSAELQKYPDVYNSMVALSVDDVTQYFLSTEGSRVVTSKAVVRLMITGQTRANDGMELLRNEGFDATTADRLPGDDEVFAKIDKIGADLEKLRDAPVTEPYDGPALLSGRAAAVFFHEVLGHRVEGQRQRGVEEGQTFTKKVGQQVLPTFLTVVDDPTLKTLDGMDLNGSYEYDTEGVRARRVEVIHDGVLREFLMSRMPVKNFARSNGHGRAQEGLMPVGRQGNLIVSSTKTVPDSELRNRFIAEIKKQGKPYGLYFEDIAGGFTLTTRALPQAFQVLPLMVWRVYADGRPDELVRGVDIVGTPLAAMNRILLTGDKTQVFNGVCGAESGQVPVAAASPAILFSEIEVQKRKQGQDRPPILPPPDRTVKTAQHPASQQPVASNQEDK
jgi:predicted Zn-dependent protease